MHELDGGGRHGCRRYGARWDEWEARRGFLVIGRVLILEGVTRHSLAIAAPRLRDVPSCLGLVSRRWSAPLQVVGSTTGSSTCYRVDGGSELIRD